MKTLKYIKVVCIPHEGIWLNDRDGSGLQKDASELIREIKRHCEHYKDISPVPYYECSFCGSEWEVTYSVEHKKILPVCCSKAEKEIINAEVI